jgi:hypothetical protein
MFLDLLEPVGWQRRDDTRPEGGWSAGEPLARTEIRPGPYEDVQLVGVNPGRFVVQPEVAFELLAEPALPGRLLWIRCERSRVRRLSVPDQHHP